LAGMSAAALGRVLAGFALLFIVAIVVGMI
jgi:hypothetical protein